MLDPIEVAMEGKINLLKEKIEEITEVKAQNQKLLLKGKILKVYNVYLDLILNILLG